MLFSKTATNRKKTIKGSALLNLTAMTATAGLAQQGLSQGRLGDIGGDYAWPFWGGNIENTHGSAFEHAITAENALQLR